MLALAELGAIPARMLKFMATLVVPCSAGFPIASSTRHTNWKSSFTVSSTGTAIRRYGSGDTTHNYAVNALRAAADAERYPYTEAVA